MADVATGSFFGYREFIVIGGRPGRLRVPLGPQPPKLSLTIVESLAVPAYDYRGYSGQAGVDYGPWTYLPWKCTLAKFMLRGGPIEVQLTYDRERLLETRTLRESATTLDSFDGFRVRQLVSGTGAWYQCLVFV